MYLPRGLERRLRHRLAAEPLVILQGARAVGKTRLVDHAVSQGWLSGVRSFLNPTELEAARLAPRDYVFNLPHGTAIDEAQLCEEILLPTKERVESAPPGSLLLTGSTRLRRDGLGGSDPLAGRVATPLHLGPMTIAERMGAPRQIVDRMFDDDPASIEVNQGATRSDLIEIVQAIGLPALTALTGADRQGRADAYLRDVTSLSSFDSLDVRRVGELARFLAGRTSTPVNVSNYGQQLEISRPTIEKYLARLEEALVVHRLPAWRRSKDKTVTATPKLHFFDTGIASAVSRMAPESDAQHLGALVESLVVNELLRQSQWLDVTPDAYHWRRDKRTEVDLVFEDTTGRAICVEVKASEGVQARDFAGADRFRQDNPDHFHRGFVFYSGTNVLSFGDDRWALPIGCLQPAQVPGSVGLLDSVKDARSRERARLRSADERVKADWERRHATRNDLLDEVDRQLVELGESLDGYEARIHQVVPERRSLRMRPIEVRDAASNGLELLEVSVTDDLLSVTVEKLGGPAVSFTEPVDERTSSAMVTALLFQAAQDIGEAIAAMDQRFDQ